MATAQIVACSTSSSLPSLRFVDESFPVASSPEYRIQPGDELDIRFFRTPELNEVVTVRPDGRISLPYISVTQVTGMTPEELDANLTEQYSEQLVEPDIDVIVQSFGGQKIYVGGEVERPGIVEYTSPMTIIEAAIIAGGFTDRADIREILLIRKGPDSQPHGIKVNVGESLAGEDMHAERLLAADVVYVPRSRIANADLFVDQYIRQLLIFRGFGINFGYDLDDQF